MFFQLDQELSLGEEELNFWEQVREWSVEPAWKCECYRYFVI